ncbi:Bro-N domain-containing protein [Salmonella enterica]|uniref:BRO-N domain-containing protein n=1 Tax=Salmonella enterica TaxID=28901 RepID=UPI0012D50F9A|nr:hypothetical protein [Salmonella enterica]EBQ9001308.1 hypothetical protein [Salmonella enterica subsp. enterica serovar Blockley]ECU7993247.1 hypothetical protein [Salmonella enterica subsp. enterica serovar Toucra]ECW2125954.1 hypothetical protein [Salmonella enterica]
MTSQVNYFYFENHSVRTVTINDDPWFVAKDACDALQLTNSRMALLALDDDEKGVSSIDTISGRQQMSIINESGLYTLILRCRDAVKPGTVPHRFRKWVTNEVLPTIRKTGRYEHPAATLLTKQLPVFIVICGAQNTSKAVSTPDSHVVFLCPEFLVYDRACG